MKKSLPSFLTSLIIAIVSVVLTWYVTSVIGQPKILWYSRPYFKVSQMAIGNIFIWNAGGKPDHNISVTLNSNLKDQEIKIVDLVSPYRITHSDNKTTIIIDELKPEETADISFLGDPLKDDIEITSFVSKNSKIKQLPMAFEPRGWQLPWVVDILIVITSLVLGTYIGCVYTEWRVKKRQAKIIHLDHT